MKDVRTHPAFKSEHAVDLESGAVLAVTMHRGTAGDTSTVMDTMLKAAEAAIEHGAEDLPEWVSQQGLPLECDDGNGGARGGEELRIGAESWAAAMEVPRQMRRPGPTRTADESGASEARLSCVNEP